MSVRMSNRCFFMVVVRSTLDRIDCILSSAGEPKTRSGRPILLLQKILEHPDFRPMFHIGERDGFPAPVEPQRRDIHSWEVDLGRRAAVHRHPPYFADSAPRA